MLNEHVFVKWYLKKKTSMSVGRRVTEAAVCRCSRKKLSLNILQNPKKNICTPLMAMIKNFNHTTQNVSAGKCEFGHIDA